MPLPWPSPAPCLFQRSVVLDAAPETVFRFHEDPRNIRQISPRLLTATIVRAGRAARVGDEFTLDLGLFGITLTRWIGIWREVEPGRRLIDEARRSPFAFFRHQHEFQPVVSRKPDEASQTRMTDHVTYRLPGGWLGKLLGETVIRALLVLAFADRHRRTQRWARHAEVSDFVE